MSRAHKKTNVTPMVKEEHSDSSFSNKVLSRLGDMEHRMEQLFSRDWLHPQFDSLLGHTKEQHLGMPFEGRSPKVDLIDNDNEVIIRAELPGIDKENIDVSMNENQVTIKGSTHEEINEKKDDYYHTEISSGSFCRTMSLPCEVNIDETTSKFKDGLLELNMPKIEKSKRKSIKIE
jgi:HSP20 family protein